MTKKIILLIALSSIILNIHSRTVDVDITVRKSPTIAKIMQMSLMCGIAGGLLASFNESSYGPQFLVRLSTLFGPVIVTLASIIATTIVSGKMRLATLLLPAYIAIPAFYISWLSTHYVINNYI